MASRNSKLSQRLKKKKPLEAPQESNVETRQFGPYSSPGAGTSFNIYLTDTKYRLSDHSQNGHVMLYDINYRKRIKDLEEKNQISDPIMTEALAHSLLISSEHEVRKLITSLTDPNRHNPWSCPADRTTESKRVTSISLRYIDLLNLNCKSKSSSIPKRP